MTSSAISPEFALYGYFRSSAAFRVRIAQILQHSEVIQGMNVTGDDLCESPYTSAPRSISRQQCRGGHDLVQIFDDRERLADRFGVGKQRRYQSLGIEAQKIRVPLLASTQMMGDAVV